MVTHIAQHDAGLRAPRRLLDWSDALVFDSLAANSDHCGHLAPFAPRGAALAEMSTVAEASGAAVLVSVTLNTSGVLGRTHAHVVNEDADEAAARGDYARDGARR
mgnify:CR=1 FL=1